MAAAFRSYDKSSDAINPEFRNAFLDVATRFGEKREQYMGDVTIEALANLHIDSVKSMTELTELLIKAREGDSTAIEQLANMGKELGRSLVSPLDSMEKSYQDQMAEADKLEAQGKMREADVKRMEAFLSMELAAISAVSGGGGVIRTGLENVGKLSLKKGVLSNRDINIRWGEGIANQGNPWEAYLQTTLPEGTIDLNKIKPNFRTFDKLLPDGTAISAKTMDTVGSKTYQDPKRITYQLNKYVDDMVNFTGDGKGFDIIHNKDISSKEMYLAVPYGTTKEQWNAINKSIDYAQSQGVKIIIKEVK